MSTIYDAVHAEAMHDYDHDAWDGGPGPEDYEDHGDFARCLACETTFDLGAGCDCWVPDIYDERTT